MKYGGAFFSGQEDVIRVEPGEAPTFAARLDYFNLEDPFVPREFRYEIEVQGAMTRDAIDTIQWTGELTLLERDAGGWHRREEPLRVVDYKVDRRYSFEISDEENGHIRG